MKFIFFLLAIIACASAQIWSNCGTPEDTLIIHNLQLSPAVPVIGKPLTVTLNGTLKSPITDGHASVLVYYNGIQLFNQEFDICDSVLTVFKCPVQPGSVDVSFTQTIPGFAPPGKYSGKLQFHDQTGAEIACLKYDFAMRASASELMAIDEDIIESVNNNPSASWVAGRNKKFEGLTLEEAKKFLGVSVSEFKNVKKVVNHAEAIPTSFDAREQWPSCGIEVIRDQAQCGSCWAFGAAEALSDRFCIASKGKVSPVLSPQYMVSCDKNNYGCNGGYLDYTWEFLEGTGTVNESCFPYASQSGIAPKCISQCVNPAEPMKFYKIKKGSIQQPYDVKSIQTSIMTYGPVEAAFSVYQDFFNYRSGVYHHTSGSLAGGHAIKMLGWGVDSKSGKDYWIMANSWGPNWGMNGFFWILRGENECGIESNIIAGLPDV